LEKIMLPKVLPAGGRFKALLHSFRNDRDGATAVEFGLIAVPFFAVIFAIIQTALVLYTEEVLQRAVDNASRKILVGKANAANTNRPAFKKLVCDGIPALIDCEDDKTVWIDVRPVGAFVDPADLTSPVMDGRLDVADAGFAFDPGGPGDIIAVRAVLSYQLLLPVPGLANLNWDRRLIMATAVFRNEPFPAPASSPSGSGS
jgi:Flp pilus assembly pilin Flp